MDFLIHWAGFIGAWLLVAGPMLQGAIELRDEELDREGFAQAQGLVDIPPRISRWWWLLPPVAMIKNRRRDAARQRAILGALTVEQRAQLMGFRNKATGWFTVAGGAFLIFLKEAWELAELYELPLWIYLVAVFVLAIAAITNTIARLSRSDEIVHIDEPGYAERMRAERGARASRSKRTPTKPSAGDA